MPPIPEDWNLYNLMERTNPVLLMEPFDDEADEEDEDSIEDIGREIEEGIEIFSTEEGEEFHDEEDSIEEETE